MSNSVDPSRPTSELVREYLRQWDTLEKYVYQEKSLSLLFQQFCPRSEDLVHVLLKVSALNDFYSTNIYDTHSVAKHIVAIDVPERIARGDLTVVNQMARISIGGKERKCYSFATKYCNHHNPEAFPIYDSYVEKMLLHFQAKDKFDEFKALDLKQYGRFVEIIKAFRQHYLLMDFSLRQIDIYLWLAGKDAFGTSKKSVQQNPG